MFALSDDGRRLAFIASDGSRTQVWLREMDTLEPHALAGTDGATYPFWSPDGGYVGFFAQGKLKKISVAGGPPQTLCDAADGRGGTWNRDGIIVFSPGPNSPLSRVSAAGGLPSPLAGLARGDASSAQRFPMFLPDGIHLLYTSSSSKPDTDGVYLATLEGSTSERLLPGSGNALYAPPATASGLGYLVFRRQNTLMAQPFDIKASKTVGEMRPLAEDVPDGGNLGFGAFSVASSAVVYRTGGAFANRSVVWMDRAGKQLGEVAKPNIFGQGLRLSPDDTTAALGIFSGSLNNVWLQDLRSDTLSRFTFLPGKNPVWSPDGKRLAFVRQTAATADFYQKATGGNGQEELLLHAGINGTTLDWSPDGKWILYHQQERQTGLDLWLLPLDGDRTPVPYLQTPSSEAFGAFSPDGHWVAFQSDETGRNQIYVQTMPSSSAKYQISTAGGTLPQWRRDGKELFYVTTDGTLMAVPMALGAPVRAGAPHALFAGVETREFAPSRDGQRFLVNVPAVGERAALPPLTMVLNWTSELKP
jgi:Tol biopolymer transport system component